MGMFSPQTQARGAVRREFEAYLFSLRARSAENLTAVNAVCAGSHIFKSEWETDAPAMLGIQAEIVNGIHTRRAVDSPRNGLLLFIVFEKYFDDSRIVIVKDKRESVYRMMVIDATAMGVKVCIPLPFLICGMCTSS
jgi:hypothetical protein